MSSLHHLEIYVSNLKISHAFWSWFLNELGYEPYQTWKDGFSYKLDDFYLVFVQTETDYLKAGYHRKHIGLNHLAFHAQSRAEVDRLTQLIQKKGMTILYPERHPDKHDSATYALFFEDPDRIKVELVSK
jgi:catechol 2,3-dioxygenase-like lactoylglutathione lyase family enzyme